MHVVKSRGTDRVRRRLCVSIAYPMSFLFPSCENPTVRGRWTCVCGVGVKYCFSLLFFYFWFFPFFHFCHSINSFLAVLRVCWGVSRVTWPPSCTRHIALENWPDLSLRCSFRCPFVEFCVSWWASLSWFVNLTTHLTLTLSLAPAFNFVFVFVHTRVNKYLCRVINIYLYLFIYSYNLSFNKMEN